MDQVRSSIVRLRFIWEKEEKQDDSTVIIKTQHMVIPGIIISISGREEAVMIANATFFNNKKSQLNFWVSFPNSTGYEQERSVPFSEVVLEDEFFCTFTLKPIEGGFIKPIQFEIQPVKRMDEVHSFVFPREEYITPTSYPNGFITCVTSKVILPPSLNV
ncbi:hypothetical protein DAI22_10g130400 [Oryza sativa Japonica Group]|nr:hypothetical protein DAI22_10g130400 [Oryza sativa Japonica Group]